MELFSHKKKKLSQFSQKYLSSATVASIDNNKCFWAANQHIRMISEESCDTEDWNNDAEKLF